MKPLAIAIAALLAVQPYAGEAQTAQAAPSEALVERFVASLPDQEEIHAAPTEIDAAELNRLLALNPGKEAQLRSILKANLACTGPAVTAGTLRMLRTVARALGTERLQKLVSFYEGPDYAAFKALGLRMESAAVPVAEDKAAMAKLMAAYPLQAFLDHMNRAGDIIAADQGFMTAAMNCASQQVDALTAAGLRAN
ncbi:MAG TPA: hypothetical protein VK403_11130 [Allosphingosinicella sp.]|nr:hypothetical protein [Allosphingosinicella sp.]